MIQNIITFIIVGFVVFLAIKRLVRYLKNPLKGCDGCDQHCQVCSLEELKKEIEEKKKNKK
jgi:large-conductance mechanosensitive channel